MVIRRFVLLVVASVSIAAVAHTPVESRSVASRAPQTITIDGRGYGHGRGMSQWGARGMARDGKTWSQIVHHYYRGVSVGTRPAREMIRVLLEQRMSAVLVTSARPFPVKVGRRTVASATPSSRFFRVRSTPAGSIVERAPGRAGPWKRVLVTTSAVAFGRGQAVMKLQRSNGTLRWYRGAIIVMPRDGTLSVVNHLGLEEYLLGVVPREMPALWPSEALKAQAVAARTYAAGAIDRARARRKYYDICATTACQAYGGAARRPSYTGQVVWLEHRRTTHAVRATARRVLVYRGEPIVAYYSSSSGGWTAAGSAPYLRTIWDPHDAGSPYSWWSKRVRVDAIEREWPQVGAFKGVRVLDRNGKGAWGGRAGSVVVQGAKGSVRVGGSTFASALGLRSRWFSVRGSEPPAKKAAPSKRTVKKAPRRAAAPRGVARYRFTRDLKPGMSGRAVTELQKRLRAEGWFPVNVSITGYYGDITRDSVMRYQRWNRIRQTGMVGPQTRARLNA